jgi:hypothetical protein
MDFRERCQSALCNYEEFECNPDDYRLLENAIFSMDTVAERLALHRLGYPQLSRKALNEEAQKIRGNGSLKDLRSCANVLKHGRSITDHRGGKFTTTATSTGIDRNNQATWYVNGKYLPTVVHDAAATLKSFLNTPST